MNRIVLGIVCCLMLSELTAQDRYMVFFSGKSGDNYPFSLSNPSDYLSERAIERRTKQNIAIDSTDLPVNPEYVTAVRNIPVDVFFSSRWLNAVLIQTDEGNIPAIEALAFVESVELIAENEKLSFSEETFNDPTDFDEPHTVSSDTDDQHAMLQIDKMHQDGYMGEGMLIAVLDNGFLGVDQYEPFQHIWDEDRMVAHKDFVRNSVDVFNQGGHGTSVFSTIAGKYDSDFIGVAPNAKYILCVTEEAGSEDRIEEYNWILGAEFADSIGVDVINTSLGYHFFDISSHDYEYQDLNGQTPVISSGADLAVRKGIIVVVSAGNEGDNPPGNWRYITPPADGIDVLTVGSVDLDFEWSPFSSLGPTSDGRVKPDVAALGSRTSIVRSDGSISIDDGTSFASPQIAGLAAGIWQANPTWTNIEVIQAIRSAGHNALSPDTLIGYGVPFYTYAVEGKVLNVNDILSEKVSVYPNPFVGNKLNIKLEEILDGPIVIEINSGDGKLVLKETIEPTQPNDLYEIIFDDIQEGLYFLSLQYADKKKIVKLINFK